MKADCTRLFAATLYDAVVVGASGITPIPRVTVFSGRPMEWEVQTLDELPPDDTKDGAKLKAMLVAAGMKFRVILKPTQGARIAVICKNEGDRTVKVDGYEKYIVFSAESTVVEDEDSMPVDVYQKLSGMEPLEVEQLTEEELLARIHARAVKTVENDKLHGLDNTAADLQFMLEATPEDLKSQLKSIAEEAGNTVFAKGAHAAGHDSTLVYGEKTRFVAVMATDFKGATIITQDGEERRIPLLRIAHTEAPEWVASDTKVAKQGLLGCWVFKTAAIGECLTPEATAYTTVGNMRVGVKHPEAISPAGQIAIPEQVWRSMQDDKSANPAHTMSEDEALAFTKCHAMTAAQSISETSSKPN